MNVKHIIQIRILSEMYRLLTNVLFQSTVDSFQLPIFFGTKNLQREWETYIGVRGRRR